MTSAPLAELHGKVAFITGGSSGIGLGLARACLEQGMRVAITYQTESHYQAAGLPDTVQAFRLDVRDRHALDQAAQAMDGLHGGVDLLANNAGIGLKTSITEADPKDWERILAINLGGVVNGIQAFVPRMMARGKPAHILATASMSGLMVGGTSGLYTTSKYAVVGLIESLRAELEPLGIGASVVCPGAVKTNISGDPASLAAAMDPLECGRRILDGVKQNALFILTHPEFGPGLRERLEVLKRSLPPTGQDPPAGRLELEQRVLRSPIYTHELKRLSE